MQQNQLYEIALSSLWTNAARCVLLEKSQPAKHIITVGRRVRTVQKREQEETGSGDTKNRRELLREKAERD